VQREEEVDELIPLPCTKKLARAFGAQAKWAASASPPEYRLGCILFLPKTTAMKAAIR
jgi:hypothetical protein